MRPSFDRKSLVPSESSGQILLCRWRYEEDDDDDDDDGGGRGGCGPQDSDMDIRYPPVFCLVYSLADGVGPA